MDAHTKASMPSASCHPLPLSRTFRERPPPSSPAWCPTREPPPRLPPPYPFMHSLDCPFSPHQHRVKRFVFDVAYWTIVPLLLLNMVSGVILDRWDHHFWI